MTRLWRRCQQGCPQAPPARTACAAVKIAADWCQGSNASQSRTSRSRLVRPRRRSPVLLPSCRYTFSLVCQKQATARMVPGGRGPAAPTPAYVTRRMPTTLTPAASAISRHFLSAVQAGRLSRLARARQNRATVPSRRSNPEQAGPPHHFGSRVDEDHAQRLQHRSGRRVPRWGGTEPWVEHSTSACCRPPSA